MRVVFFGTPEFAVPSLRALLGEGFDVAAVVTQPDKPQGRSRSQVVPPPIKVVAQAEGVPALQPVRPSGGPFLAELRALAPDIGVVVAYGHILPPEVLALPPRGMVNVHASLLPALRGAAPIAWAILQGLESTGVTIMQVEAGLDSGPILLQLATPVAADETAGELTERLAELGAQALVEALMLLEQDGLTPEPQDHARATSAPKLTRESARLYWDRPAAVVARTIRALDPRPGAWAVLAAGAPGALDAVEVKLFGARAVAGNGAPGEVLAADERLQIACASGAVEVEEVQPAGKARMLAADWIRGRGVRPGGRFS
jgi:methionyl-tRNA formyltransferase